VRHPKVSDGTVDASEILFFTRCFAYWCSAYTHALRSVTECEFWQIERGELMRRARPDLYEDLVAADEKENGTDPA